MTPLCPSCLRIKILMLRFFLSLVAEMFSAPQARAVFTMICSIL